VSRGVQQTIADRPILALLQALHNREVHRRAVIGMDEGCERAHAIAQHFRSIEAEAPLEARRKQISATNEDAIGSRSLPGILIVGSSAVD
jgi:hypothetical protein